MISEKDWGPGPPGFSSSGGLINLRFTAYTNINSLKLKTVVKNFSIKCDGRDNTKSCVTR